MRKYALLVLFFLTTLLSTNAQYTTLLNFAGSANGNFPRGGLISDGTFLYGMTTSGGTSSYGTIFKIKSDGTGYSKLFDFTGIASGMQPEGSLISDGTFLYGMTVSGGTNGRGVIFKIMTDGTAFSKLLDFDSINGSYPGGSLISDGTFLYGMTSGGGANDSGVVFKIEPNGTGYMKLHDFTGIDGVNPYGSLTTDGTYLYGMTEQGGVNDLGTIFKMMPDGTGYSKLLDFAYSGITDGWWPEGDLISDGTFLFGMTKYGGITNKGIIFKIKPDGTGYSKMLDFDTLGSSNGRNPRGSFIFDGTYLYATTRYGGIYSNGTIFKIKPNGSEYTKLFDFGGAGIGGEPNGSIISDGSFLYGMTLVGGTSSMGTIFKAGMTTDIKEFDDAINFNVYPNPTDHSITINLASFKTETVYNIVDILGRKVVTGILKSKTTNLNIDQLTKGIYLLQIGEHNEQSERIVKK